MPLTAEEERVLQQLRAITRAIQNKSEEAIEHGMARHDAELFHQIRIRAAPEQRKIGAAIGVLVKLFESNSQESYAKASSAYRTAFYFMVGVGLLAALVGVIIAVVVVRQVMRQARILEHQASYDSLTALPNRTCFTAQIKLQLDSRFGEMPKAFSVLFIDLDRFKDVNDTLSHNVGDILLQKVAVELQASLREGDM